MDVLREMAPFYLLWCHNFSGSSDLEWNGWNDIDGTGNLINFTEESIRKTGFISDWAGGTATLLIHYWRSYPTSCWEGVILENFDGFNPNCLWLKLLTTIALSPYKLDPKRTCLLLRTQVATFVGCQLSRHLHSRMLHHDLAASVSQSWIWIVITMSYFNHLTRLVVWSE